MQAACGLLSITGTAGGELARCGYGVTDVTAGQFAVIGILLALQARARTGLGQMVDVSMFDGMISTMSSNFASFLGSGEVPRPMGTRFPTVVPYCTLETADRPVAIAVGSEKLWRAFCAAIGREHWATDEAYRTNALRIANRATLEPQLNEWFRTRTSAEWCERLGAAGVPCSPVRDFAEVVADPQSEARGMFPSRMHPAAGEHRVTGTPVKLSATPGGSLRPAPALGADTDEVLRRVPD